MVVVTGLTLTVIVGAVPLNVVPSDSVPEMVPVPVTVNVSVAELPLQIDVVPVRFAEGIAFPSNSSAPISGAVPVPV